jgi:hypothetical protein
MQLSTLQLPVLVFWGNMSVAAKPFSEWMRGVGRCLYSVPHLTGQPRGDPGDGTLLFDSDSFFASSLGDHPPH